MKRKKFDKKRTIKKKIELKQGGDFFSTSKGIHREKKMNSNATERLKKRVYGDNSKKKTNVNGKNYPYKEFKKKIYVDYDVLISIPSHNRYEKIKRLLSQFYNQETKYTFKIILLNDGSNDERYDEIVNDYPHIIYLKNDEPNGKMMHWYCYNQMWDYVKDYECHAVLQMDDDFILCDNFLDKIVDLYFIEKEKNDNIKGIAPHLWSFNKNKNNEMWWEKDNFVDGIVLMDVKILNEINFKLKNPNNEKIRGLGVPVGVWNQISNAITKNNGYIFRTKESLVYHDDINGDSKLHKGFRKEYNKIIYTQKCTETLKNIIK